MKTLKISLGILTLTIYVMGLVWFRPDFPPFWFVLYIVGWCFILLGIKSR